MNSLTIFFVVVPFLVVILLFLDVLLAAHRPDTEKVTASQTGDVQCRSLFQLRKDLSHTGADVAPRGLCQVIFYFLPTGRRAELGIEPSVRSDNKPAIYGRDCYALYLFF